MTDYHQFSNRQEAGIKLAEQIETSLEPDETVMVLGLPRGGVPVAYEVARHLRAPMDVLVVRKLGYPGNREYAVGALAEGGMKVTNNQALDHLSHSQWEQVLAKEQLELERRIHTYRSGKAFPTLQGKTVVIVDDGLATGATMLAAVKTVKRYQPRRIIVAAPVGARETCQEILNAVNEVICLRMPEPFHGVGAWYQSFPQTSDETVVHLLDMAQQGFNSNQA